MPTIKINGINYDVDGLSNEAKAHLQRLGFIEEEIQRHQLGLDVLRVARDEIGARLDRVLVDMELNSDSAASHGVRIDAQEGEA